MKIHNSATNAMDWLADEGTLVRNEPAQTADDPLAWKQPHDYSQLLRQARERTGLACGMAWGTARISGLDVVLVASDLDFMMGSIGQAESATLELCFEQARRRKWPVVWLARGSGLRMHEGPCAMTGLRRVLAARNDLASAGLPLVTLGADPLLGGAAMAALQADVVLGIEGARIGHAGVRVVEQHVQGAVPADFQTAAYALANGQLDAVVTPEDLPAMLGSLLRCLAARTHLAPPTPLPPRADRSSASDPGAAASAWELVQQVGSDDRPTTRQTIATLFDDLVELRGDRIEHDDPAIAGGLGRIASRGVASQGVIIIAHDRMRSAYEKARHNFAMPHPAGIRKAIRLVRLAERLSLPIVTLIDSPGACPDVLSERQGMAGVLGQLACELLAASVPSVAVILGEACSSGASAMSACRRVIMSSSSWLGIIHPIGAAAILWKDPAKADQAATSLRLTPADCLHHGLVHAIADPANLRDAIVRELAVQG